MATPSFHRPLKGEAGPFGRHHLCLLEQAPVRHSHGHPEAQRDFVTCPDFQATVGNGPTPFFFGTVWNTAWATSTNRGVCKQ